MSATLEERTRAVARARIPDWWARRLGTLAGLVALAIGYQWALWPVAIVGSGLLGWALNPDPARMYVEGFSDGLAFDPAPANEPRARDTGDGGLAAVPRNAEPDAAGGRVDPDQRGDPGPGAGDDAYAATRSVARLGPASATFDPAGNPTHATGPRRATFPIPPAYTIGSPVEIASRRASPRRKVARQRRAAS